MMLWVKFIYLKKDFMGTSRITIARARYKPERVRVLLVGEAPPNNGAFFYSCEYDNLFKEYIKAIFYGKSCDYVFDDERKGKILEILRFFGIYLMDLALDLSLKELMESVGIWSERERIKGTREKLRLYDELHLKEPFIQKLNSEKCVDKDRTKIIFIQKSVNKYLATSLREDNGYTVINKEIPFPSRSKKHIHDFEKGMNEAMREAMGEEGFNELKRKIGDVFAEN